MKSETALALGSVAVLAAVAERTAFGWMSSAERARLQAIVAPLRRRQFLAGRWLLRQVLAKVGGGQPADWPLDAPAEGPPTVLQSPAQIQAARHCSLAHSGDWVVCAVASAPVGVDIEVARARPIDIEAWISFALVPAEREHCLAAAGDEGRKARLLMHWTAKEAWLKAHGRGLDFDALQRIEALPAADAACNALVCARREFTLTLSMPAGGIAEPMLLEPPMAALGWVPWRIRELDNAEAGIGANSAAAQATECPCGTSVSIGPLPLYLSSAR